MNERKCDLSDNFKSIRPGQWCSRQLHLVTTSEPGAFQRVQHIHSSVSGQSDQIFAARIPCNAISKMPKVAVHPNSFTLRQIKFNLNKFLGTINSMN